LQLTNVIVTRADVAGKILKKGRLARRVVFLPLDKMNARCISHQELQSARRAVGKDNVFRAIDLVNFDPSLSAAMDHIFGGVFVCTNVDVAKRLIFQHGIGNMAVTLDGDKISKSGELSGGAPSNQASILTSVASISEAAGELNRVKAKLEDIEQRLRGAGPAAKRFKELSTQLEIKRRDLEAVRERLSHTDHQRTAIEVQELKEQLKVLKEESEGARKTESEGKKKVQELEYKIKNAKQLKEKELKVSDGKLQ